MAKRTKKLFKSNLKLEALEQRQLLAGVTGSGTELTPGGAGVNNYITHSNGNHYDQVLLTGTSVSVTNDAGTITRVSFLDLQGDIIQAEFSGAGTLTVSMDSSTATANVAPSKYNQSGVLYEQGLASFTVQGSDASTNLTLFTVGTATAANQSLFDSTHQGGNNIADVQRITIVADPSNPNGSTFGGIRAGNAIFSGSNGVVGITASNVNVQDVVRVGDINATGTASPALVFGKQSQFVTVEVDGGGLISANGKAINNSGSYGYSITLAAGTTSNGAAQPQQNTYSQQVFTDANPNVTTVAKTLSLTSGNDAGASFLGGAADDTFIAAIGADGVPNSGTTLNAGDSINGGGGNDTLSISVSGSNTSNQTTSSFTASNIETLSIANFESSTNPWSTTIDLAGAPQVTAVVVTASSDQGDTTLSSVQNLVSATMKNGSGDLILTYSAGAIAGTADVQSLTLSGQTAGTFAADGVETLAITSNTAANSITLGGTPIVATITVAGDKDLTIAALPNATATKIDASAFTGKLSATASQVVNYNLIGGAGNDTFTLGSTNFTASDSVDGGAGSDTLSIDNTANMDQSILAKVSNVETLKLTGVHGGTGLTLSDNVGPTTFDLSAASVQKIVFTTAPSATPATAYSNATTVVLTGDANSSDSIINSANIALTVNANTADVGTNLTLTGGKNVDTLNLKAAAASTTTWTTVTNVDQANITGSSDITINLVAGNLGTNNTKLTIDASAATGAVTIDGHLVSAGALNITTGSGNDVLTAGTKGTDTLIGGAGNDSFILSALKATNVIGGGAGTDSLTISTGGTNITASSVFAGVTGVETLILGKNVTATLDAPLTASAGITTVNLSVTGGAETLTLKSGYTDALTVILTNDAANTDTIDNQANVALTVVGNVDDINAGTVINGGTGLDVLNLKADGKTANLDATQGIDSIIIGIDPSDTTKAATVVMGANNTQIAAGKTLKVDASALTNSAFTFTGDDTENNGFLSVTGGAGNDTIRGANSTFDTLIGGAGNDSIVLTQLQATNIVDGGAGSDTLSVSTTIATSTALLGVTNVETLKMIGATNVTLTSNIKSSTGIGTIDIGDAANNVVTISAGVTDALTVNMTGDGGGTDKVDNSAANVTLTVNAGLLDIDATTSVLGGTGVDTINLKGVTNGDTTNLSAIRNVEVVNVLKSTTTGTVTVGNAAVVAAGKTMTIDASANDSAMTINASALTLASGSVSIKGGSAADTISGGANPDTFTGGAGGDTFTLAASSNNFIFDNITDIQTGDKLAGGGDGSETFNNTKLVLASNLATFSDYLDAAAAANDGATNGVFRWFQVGGNTYVVEDLSDNTVFTAGTDRVIQLNGLVTVASASTTDTITLTIT